MTLTVFGIHYKTTPLVTREKIAQLFDVYEKNPHALFQIPGLKSGFTLTTCNRTELYCDIDQIEPFYDWLVKTHQLNPTLFYCYQEDEALQHILRVTVGLDSMMIGEAQILGQFKRAYAYANEHNTVHGIFKTIFPFIFQATKRIRAQSGIGHHAISIASATAKFLQAHFKERFSKCKILIIGSGETATLVSKYLVQQQITSFIIASRTLEHAHRLAKTLNAPSIAITEIPNYLSQADIVITATACPVPFIHPTMIEQAMVDRQNNPMVLIDLSIPRNIDPEIKQFPQVQLINIDDLHQMIESNLEKKQWSAHQAEQLITQEISTYQQNHRTRQATPLISDYRNHIQTLAQHELARATEKLAKGQCQYHVMSEFSKRLINKITHLPTLALKQVAEEDKTQLLELLQYLLQTPTESTAYEELT